MLAILVVALLVRAGAIVAMPDLKPVSDPAEYARHGYSLADGHGYPDSVVTGGPTAIRPPGFPVLVGAVFALTDDSVGAVRLVQALLGVLIVALIALIALELWGRRVGLLAAALAAVFPPLVVAGMPLFSEPLFVVLELGSVLAVLHWRKSRGTPTLVIAGVLVGLSMLTRANGVLVLIPLLFAVWNSRKWRSARSYASPALLAACAVLVVAPWTIRNAVVMDAFVPVSDQDGYTLAGTYNETSRELGGAWIPVTLDQRLRSFIEERKSAGEVKLGRALRSEAKRFALDHPGYLPTVAIHNTLQLFSLSWSDEKIGQRVGAGLSAKWAAVTALGFYPFLVLALVGLLAGAWRQMPRWMSAIPLLMLSVIMVVASSRFRAPIDPFVLMFASVGAVTIADRFHGPQA